MKITCCKDCTERFPACHDTCERYQAEKEKAREAREKQIAFEIIESTIAKQKTKIWNRMRRSHRR